MYVEAAGHKRRRRPETSARAEHYLATDRPKASWSDVRYVPRSSPLAAQTPVQQITDKVNGRFRAVEQSMKKLNVVAKLVRRLHVDDAILQLSMYNKRLAARILLNAVLSLRAGARSMGLTLEHLVVDELLVLKHFNRARGPSYRAKGGRAILKTQKANIWLRLRVVPGARMKTVVLQPWFERRHRHRDRHRRGDRTRHRPSGRGLANAIERSNASAVAAG